MDLGIWLWPAPQNNNLKTNWPHIIWNKSLCSLNYNVILVITLNSCPYRIGESLYCTILIIIISQYILVCGWASFLSFFFPSCFFFFAYFYCLYTQGALKFNAMGSVCPNFWKIYFASGWEMLPSCRKCKLKIIYPIGFVLQQALSACIFSVLTF